MVLSNISLSAYQFNFYLQHPIHSFDVFLAGFFWNILLNRCHCYLIRKDYLLEMISAANNLAITMTYMHLETRIMYYRNH